MTWARARQGETQAQATNHRDTWTLTDLEFVEAFRDDVSDTELATALGRTLYAIWSIKAAIVNDGVRERAQRVQRAPTAWDRGWTGLEGDEFPS